MNTTITKIEESEFHNSMRGWFAGCLYNEMITDKDVVVVSADLGYGLWDKIRDDFSDRFYNIGSSEQAGAGICVGLALAGKKPFFYSITPFLLYRPFETLRTYINHERIPVRLIGSGRDRDYKHDGISHWAEDVDKLFIDPTYEQGYKPILGNIKTYWPIYKRSIPKIVRQLVTTNEPAFLSLRR